MMNYGYALTDDALLYCAGKLGVAPSRDMCQDGKVVFTLNKYNSGYLGLVRTRLRSHLEFCGNIRSGSIAVQQSFAPEHLHYLILFSNYDVAFKRDRARQFMLESIGAIAQEMKKGFAGYEGRVPYLVWHWDVEKCSFGYESHTMTFFTRLTAHRYSAPFDDFNLWPAEENRHWRRSFAIEADDASTNEHRLIPVNPTRGRLPREKSSRADDHDGLRSN